MKRTRVLVVDDSRSMRQMITAVLTRAADIEVVGEASDPFEAREAIKALNPDVITLDVEMPKMNGIDFLEKLMRLRPTPVIMVSNLTSAGGEITIKALEIGAVDCIAKPQPGDREIFGDLVDKVRVAVDARVGPYAGGRPDGSSAPDAGPEQSYRWDGRIVAIGSSTGGVEALTTLLASFPANCPPTVITQHMPPVFTKSFADRLNRLYAPTIAEATDGAVLTEGRVYIAPGSEVHHLEVSGAATLRCRLRAADPVNGHRPSVDVLFNSVARVAGAKAVGVILTGMGRDGAKGLLTMRQAGATTLGQDGTTSLVYGMPKAAFEVGAVEKQLPIRKIGSEIISVTNS